MGYTKGEGYQFLVSVARDEMADEEERLAALHELAHLGNEETLSLLITLYPQPATINFKRAIIRTIGLLEEKLGNGENKDRLGGEQF